MLTLNQKVQVPKNTTNCVDTFFNTTFYAKISQKSNFMFDHLDFSKMYIERVIFEFLIVMRNKFLHTFLLHTINRKAI